MAGGQEFVDRLATAGAEAQRDSVFLLAFDDVGAVGDDESVVYTPMMITALPEGLAIRKGACGNGVVALLAADGSLWTFGSMMTCMLGLGSDDVVVVPTMVRPIPAV